MPHIPAPGPGLTGFTHFASVFCLMLGPAFWAPLQAGDALDTESQDADKAVVVPYKTRPAPTHRVDLHDDRIYFLNKLEEKDGKYMLHTLEGEVIEVEASDIAEIVELKSD